MANGFGSLYIGSSGLRNAQYALNTTANNLANTGTTGYVREQVRFADQSYDILKRTAGNINIQQSGLGVSIGDVVHARDIFLDKVYRQESGRLEFYSAQYETISYIEDLMQELDGEEFQESIEELWQAFQEVSTKMDTTVYQNLVLEKADLFVTRTKALYTDFQNYQSNINDQIKDDVDRVNEIGQRIYELNLEIMKVEAGGVETAMTLRDERDNLLDELSQYGSVGIKEYPNGLTYVDFENVRFVDENRCYNIALKTERSTKFYTPYWEHMSDVEKGQYTEVFKTDGVISTELNTDIGAIKSKMIARGDAYGRCEDLESTEAYDKIAGSTMMEVEAQIDLLFSSIVKAVNDVYCPNIESDAAIVGTDGTTYPAGTLILDVENCAVGVDGTLPPRELFTRDGMDRYTEVTGTDGKTYYVYNEEDPNIDSTRYGIGNVSVNSELQKQITLMPTYQQGTNLTVVDYDMGAKLAEVWNVAGMRLDPYDENPTTFEGYYNRILGALGTAGDTYYSAVETQENSVASYDAKRQQVTGVSSDEELTYLIKYQAAYNASSRFMTVISEMTELIVTGLV